MVEYTIIWEINLEADSPVEAAIKALEIHRDPESLATNFIVVNQETGEEEDVDLGN